jgi:DNA-binding HxlR family transcriptional regulator
LSQELPILKKGSFYTIRDAQEDLIMEDRTKRGLTVREKSLDEKLQVLADKGMIHDMDGIGHLVPIRWYFPKKEYDLQKVLVHAEDMEKRYTELRELTCPDDND